MKKLIKFEAIKACHNTLYLAIAIVISLILLIHMLYSFNYYHPSYVTKQQNNAKTQLQTNQNLNDEIMLSYQRIAGNISWQDIYQNYNEIDSYNQGMITDLDYDSQSNIDYRNYQLKYQINPDDNSGGNWLINLYDGFLKYVVIVIIIFSSLNIILVEFQEQTSNYLFCLGYSYKKIFLSRLKLQRNPLFNEQAVCNIFKQNGYKIVYPETLSLQEQISLCKGASSLAAWEGTLALQAVFCPNGAERIILNRAIEPDVFHRFMEQLKDLPTTHIDCSLNPIPVSHIHGPWIVGFTSELQEFCRDRNWKHKGNVNFVPYRALLKFHQEWALRNPYQRVDIPFDELHYCQSKIKTKLPKTIKGIFFQILACFTFGQLRKHLRHKSKNI